jgi:predicted  nucleic acid-binding Zn-ribbon protein
MSMWDKVKKSGQKTKLRGNMALLDREATARKKVFGIDLYDMMTNDKNKLLGVTAGTLFKGQQTELKEPFEKARDDISGIQAQKDIKQKDLDVLEVKGAGTLPDTTINQKMTKAGRAISNASNGTKLQAQIALLDREMKIRKEQFGVEVYGLSKASEEKESGGGIRASISSTLSSLSKQEKDIQECIDKAKKDVGAIEGRIKSKQTEIGILDEEMKPLAS